MICAGRAWRALFTILAGLCALGGCARREAPVGLVLITIDTCRADRLGCYGSQTCETGALDAIAERGALFLRAGAPCPITLPSHCSILTGLYPDRHTVRDNGAGRLPDEAMTLAEVLRERGWRTAAFIAGVPLENRFGTAQGFDSYDDDFLSVSAGRGGREGQGDAEDILNRLLTDQRTADEVTARALPWIREALDAGDGFFAWLHYFDPHQVYQPPPHLAARYGDSPYDGEVAFVDEQVGLLLEGLGASAERILIAVTADHGESLGEHGEATHGFFLYEAAVHVPLVIAGPGVPAGRRVAEPVSLVSVMPTLLELLELAVPDGLDGRSAASLIRDEAQGEPELLYAEALFPRLHFDWAGTRSVRRGRWKLIEAPRPELYDLEQDPHETSNVFAEHPDVVSELRAELRRSAQRGGVLGAVAAGVDEETRAQLEALGYLGDSHEPAAAEEALWDLAAPDPKDRIDVFADVQKLPQFILSGDSAQAASLVESVKGRDPQNVPLRRQIYRLQMRVRRWSEARCTAVEITELDPQDVDAFLDLARIDRALENAAGAKRWLREATERRPDDFRAWQYLGDLLSEEGRHEEARTALARAVDLAPGDADLRSSLGRVYEDAGDTVRALAEYGRALSLDPGCSEALNQKALLLSHSGRVEEAVELLRAGLEHLPEDVETLNNLAWLLVDEGLDAGEAYELSGRALSLSGEDAAVLDTRGWSAVRSGRVGEALEPLRRALELTGDAEVRAHLGVALCETGRAEEGRAELRAAIRERAALGEIPEVARWLRP